MKEVLRRRRRRRRPSEHRYYGPFLLINSQFFDHLASFSSSSVQFLSSSYPISYTSPWWPCTFSTLIASMSSVPGVNSLIRISGALSPIVRLNSCYAKDTASYGFDCKSTDLCWSPNACKMWQMRRHPSNDKTMRFMAARWICSTWS